MKDCQREFNSKIEAEIIKLIGNDSELYAGLNSVQREAISKIYNICASYSKIMSSIKIDQKENGNEEEMDSQIVEKRKKRILPGICAGGITLAAYFLGKVLSQNIWITGASVLIGIAVGELIRQYAFSEQDDLEASRIIMPSVHKEEVELVLNDSETDASILNIKQATKELMQQINMLLKPKDMGHDITKDIAFAEWVQKIMSVIQYIEDRQFKVLIAGELVTKLSNMGIYIYDKIQLAQDGTIIMPMPDLFVIKKLGENTVPEVSLPAVCYKDKILVKGEIIF